MEALKTLFWIINILSAIVLIVLILMQHGKGADAGAAFGSGSAQGVFGASGSANFLSRGTAVAAIAFFSTCLILGYIAAHSGKNMLGLQDGEKPAAVTQPATPQPVPAKPAVIPEQ
ncbi:preprotein translocase subunit SecG [Neisseria sp. Ec49-e6-T10]|uniref:preprotein translocase subunit SecG n=1 Tax=Neisseria sp. Ec49-e6-T10 TaxID=3140744 RepID=UPI003EB780FD